MSWVDGKEAEVYRICKWRLATCDALKRHAMFCGGFDEVCQAVMLNLIKMPPPDNVKITTGVVNQLRWTLSRMMQIKVRQWKIEEDEDACSPQFYNSDLSAAMELKELQRDIERSFEASGANERDRDVVYRRMNGETFESIGEVHKVTRERIRQIEGRQIRRMQQPHSSGLLVGHC